MVLTALAAAATTKAATTATAAIITGATAVPGTPPSAGACARAGRHWLSGRRAFLFSTLLRHRLLLAILLLAICEVDDDAFATVAPFTLDIAEVEVAFGAGVAGVGVVLLATSLAVVAVCLLKRLRRRCLGGGGSGGSTAASTVAISGWLKRPSKCCPRCWCPPR